MTWHNAGDFALWTGAILVLLLIVLFCACGIMALYDGLVDRRARAKSEIAEAVAQERAFRKAQNSELRARIRKLEIAVRELNPGGNI